MMRYFKWVIVVLCCLGLSLASDPRFVILDNSTGLMWTIGPDEDTTWYDARDFAYYLGPEWRLPTYDELEELFHAGISPDSWNRFANSGYLVWSSEIDGFDARYIIFGTGGDHWTGFEHSRSMRVFAVNDTMNNTH